MFAAIRRPMGENTVNWFSRTTSIAGMQVSNWITRYSGCRRTLDYLLSIHSLKQAAAQPVHDCVENNSAKRAGAYHHGHKY